MKMIEVKNLTFSYGKDKQALHGLNFSVADGEIFGFGAEWFREVHHPKDIDRHLKRAWRRGFPFWKGFENRTDAGVFSADRRPV